VLQKNRRTRNRSTTGWPATEISARRRSYRLCTRRDRPLHDGQTPCSALTRAETSTPDSDRSTCSTTTPAKYGRNTPNHPESHTQSHTPPASPPTSSPNFGQSRKFDNLRPADVLRFAHDLKMPPTSNQAERDPRPSKVHQNISGRLTSEKRTQDRYTIRGYLSTAAKHGRKRWTPYTRRSWDDPGCRPVPPQHDQTTHSEPTRRAHTRRSPPHAATQAPTRRLNVYGRRRAWEHQPNDIIG
jgi:hypothetical protein